MIIGVNHTSFTVKNLDISIPFYRDLLGLSIINIAERPPEFSEKVTGIPGAYIKIAYLDAWGHKLELIQYLMPHGKKIDARTCDVGSAHLAFNVNDIYRMYKELVDRGVIFKSEPIVIPSGPNKGGLTIYLEDPDGIILEFINSPEF